MAQTAGSLLFLWFEDCCVRKFPPGAPFMSGCRNLFCFVFFATGAGISIFATCSTGCLFGSCQFPVVGKFLDDFSFFKHFSTVIAVYVTGVTFCFTGCFLCKFCDFGMSGSWNGFRSGFLTGCAGINFFSILCTTCLLCCLSIIPCMTSCRTGLLLFDYSSTDTAVTSFRFSSVLAGCWCCRIFHFCMTRFWNAFGSGLVAGCAGVGFFSVCCAGRCFGNFSIIPGMSCCRKSFLFFDHCVADAAVASFCLTSILAGC